jgi:hypothetical protein
LSVHARFHVHRNNLPTRLRIRPPPRRHALPSRFTPLVPAQAISIRSHFLIVHVDVDREVHIQCVFLPPTPAPPSQFNQGNMKSLTKQPIRFRTIPTPLAPHNRRVTIPTRSPHNHCEPLVLLLLRQRGDTGDQRAKGRTAAHGVKSCADTSARLGWRAGWSRTRDHGAIERGRWVVDDIHIDIWSSSECWERSRMWLPRAFEIVERTCRFATALLRSSTSLE